jgi:hypothetical protein
MPLTLKQATAAASVLFAALSGPAAADTIGLNYSETTAGITGPGGASLLAVPGSYGYTNGFVSGAASTVIPGTNYGFYDDYVFTISGAAADSVTSTISLSGPTGTLAINNLNERIYSSAGQMPPVLGAVAGEIDSTTVFSNGSATAVEIMPTVLDPGTYVLEIRGIADPAGGTYSGSLDLTTAESQTTAPVPVPAALPLLVSGLGGLGLLRRRTRNRQDRARARTRTGRSIRAPR